MRRSDPRHRPIATLIVGLMIACATSSSPAAGEPGIVDGPTLRVSGSHTFHFNPSAMGGSIAWTVDRETVSDAGLHTRTNGILSRTGPTATFSLSAVSGGETIYYIRAADAGFGDEDTVQVFPANSKTWFTYSSPGNPDVRVYCVIPSSLSAATHVVLAMHGNSRTASSYCDDWRTWGTQHDYIVLCPYYDLVNWPTTGSYQMGNVFAGDDCSGALNPKSRWSFTTTAGIHARARAGFALSDPRFDLWGFSGGGQHVHRFMVFMPDAPVRVAIAAGSGWYTAPDLSIDCPYGLDHPALDFTSQDLRAWTRRDMILMVGTADTVRDADLRVTPRADAQGLNRYERAGYMMAMALAIDPATRWQKIDVPGVAHEAEPMAEAAQAFLSSTTLDAPLTPAPHEPGASLRVSPNPVSGTSQVRGEGWADDRLVEVSVYDLRGRRVASRVVHPEPGRWQVAWSDVVGGRIAPGVYLVHARNRTRHTERKVLILR